MKRSNYCWICKGLAFLAVVTLLPFQAHGAGYIKFDGIVGESHDKDHKEWIDLVGVSFAVTRAQTTAYSGRRTESPIPHEVTVTKELDKSSPKIAEALTTDKKFSRVMVHLTESIGNVGQTPYYSIEMGNVLVTGYNMETTNSVSLPREVIDLSFTQIKWRYLLYDEATPGPGIDQIEFAKNEAAFEVALEWSGAGDAVLTWTRTDAEQYRILHANTVSGPYRLYDTYADSGATPPSLNVPFSPGFRFYRVEAVP